MARPVFKTKFFSDSMKISMMLKNFHIKPVTKIKYSFDPFCENTSSIRRVMSALNTKNVLKTSGAMTKIDVRSDKCKPQIEVELNDGHKLIFKTEHLKASEVMEKLKDFIDERESGEVDEDISLTKMTGKMKKKK